MTGHAALTCTIATALLVALLTTAGAQSLGEIARQEQARRKAVTAGKVYTNETLPAVPPAAAATQAPAGSSQSPAGAAASAASPDAKAGEKKADDKKDDEKKDEAYWRNRLTKAREALSRAESFAAALQSRINALSNDFVNRDDPAQRNIIAADRDKALAELDRVRTEIRELNKSIDDTREEARREGAPAGWVR
jgi:hypothetical protein